MESVNTRTKFEVLKFEPPYEPGQMTLPDFETVAELTANFEGSDRFSHQLFLTNEAMSQITTHIEWGESTERNCIEQGGILLGQAFRDSERGITFGVVNEAIPAASVRASSVHLEMSHQTWKDMLDSADRILEENPERELHVIGWYHTHPNGLHVFMSGTDRETQARMFAHDWHFAMVLNPQTRQWRSFFGGEAEECRGFVIAEENRSAVVEEPAAIFLEENEPNMIQGAVIEQVFVSYPNTTPRRRRKVKPSILLWACVILLSVIIVLQLLTLGLFSVALQAIF